MTTPKIKVGDRVKWLDYEGRQRKGVIVELHLERNAHYVKEAQELLPGRWHESHLSLDVPEAAKATKFKIGDRVRRANEPGWVVVQCHDSDCYTVAKSFEYRNQVSGDGLSLDVPEPKKCATDMEVQLGIEIINLNKTYKVQTETIVYLSNRLTEEIGARHRERIAKEDAQKELVDAKNSVSNNYNAFVRGCESLTAAQKKNSQLTASLAALKSGIDKLRELASEVSP